MFRFDHPELFFPCNKIGFADRIACLALPSHLPPHLLHPPQCLCLYESEFPLLSVSALLLNSIYLMLYIMFPVGLIFKY